MEHEKTKKYVYFIGIDVSKDELDFAVRRGRELEFHKEIKNQVSEINLFIHDLKKLPNFTLAKSIFCMEQTGIYCNHLISCLKKVKANIVCTASEHIRQSIGKVRGKNDKIDAIRISEYAYTQRDILRFFTPKRPVIEQLRSLNTLRNRMISLQMSLRIPLKEQAGFIRKGMSKQILVYVNVVP
ncbi:transposase [Mucilaginibacter sp. HMF5004]|uniref:IS110 family transposase n=1 Tax=Mucilaginibacter rivuli TaxID=2857527 RepID=UPI001C5F8EC4|nr:transposase [Mucilaginibacter rivuli]MBW4890142.1 transposase [Mucilaginibacter rivuli]